MKKIKKIISIGSLSSLLLMPLVAASCKKNDNDEKVQIINNESNSQTSKQMTPPNSINDNDDKSDKNEKTDNNQNSESLVNPNETDDEKEKKKIEDEKKKIEEEKKLKEKQEQEDKNNIEKVKKIIEEQKDAFGSFHTRKDFLDQINVFAKEEGIKNLELAHGNKDTTFEVGNNKPENNVKLRLGIHEFEVQLGKVLKDRVATKYYIENNKGNIITVPDGKFSNLQDNEQNVIITQIGYSLKSKEYSNNEKVIEIDNMPKNTKEVPKHLPLKISSLKFAFKDFKFEKVIH
ncbi:variable surface lipoprotein [Mycoplasmopsis bovis]